MIRLMKKTAHAEYPRSRTRHLVSNIRILAANAEEIQVASAFVTYRMKLGNSDAYVGSTHYRLRRIDGQLRIVEKRCFLTSKRCARMAGSASFCNGAQRWISHFPSATRSWPMPRST